MPYMSTLVTHTDRSIPRLQCGYYSKGLRLLASSSCCGQRGPEERVSSRGRQDSFSEADGRNGFLPHCFKPKHFEFPRLQHLKEVT